MITHTKEIKEYREDGSLMYECTMAFLSTETGIYIIDELVKKESHLLELIKLLNIKKTVVLNGGAFIMTMANL